MSESQLSYSKNKKKIIIIINYDNKKSLHFFSSLSKVVLIRQNEICELSLILVLNKTRPAKYSMRYIKLSWLPLTYFHGHIETASWENNFFFFNRIMSVMIFATFRYFSGAVLSLHFMNSQTAFVKM